MPGVVPASLVQQLVGLPGFDEASFEAVHAAAEPPISLRLHPLKWSLEQPLPQLGLLEPVPWCSLGRYLPQRPVFAMDPCWHGGAYYVQEASSMALEQAFRAISIHREERRVVLDLCAAPGGKSTHLASLLQPTDVLISNEVIQGRVGVLLENITRWGHANNIVTQNDPADFGKIPALVDVLVADAPCSGSGLFRRDPAAIAHWSTEAVESCSLRQRRILQDALPCLKPGGYLIYSTCSYSPAEDEAILDWLVTEQHMEPVPLSMEAFSGWQVAGTGWRAFPHLVQGEGFFIGVLRKKMEASDIPDHSKPPKSRKPSSAVKPPLLDWLESFVQPVAGDVWHHVDDKWYWLPDQTMAVFKEVQPLLRIRKAGVLLGTCSRGIWQPDHTLALSDRLSADAPSVSLSLPAALDYLRGQPPVAEPDIKGWQIVRYQGVALGWAKYLGNRVNNYLPISWRLRKMS